MGGWEQDEFGREYIGVDGRVGTTGYIAIGDMLGCEVKWPW